MKDSEDLPSHLSPAQAARLAGVTRQAVDYAIKTERLESEEVFGAPMVKTADVIRLWREKDAAR